jgi:hypothetical protein
VRSSLLHLNLRLNGSQAYFVDGAVGNASTHAAVHSTVYAAAAGVADVGGQPLAAQLTSFLAQHGVAPSSCMMGRWWVEGLYRLGVWTPQAADLALALLTSPVYPSWLDMIAQVCELLVPAQAVSFCQSLRFPPVGPNTCLLPSSVFLQTLLHQPALPRSNVLLDLGCPGCAVLTRGPPAPWRHGAPKTSPTSTGLTHGGLVLSAPTRSLLDSTPSLKSWPSCRDAAPSLDVRVVRTS